MTQAKPKIKKFELIFMLLNIVTYVVWLFFNHDLYSVISWASYMFYMLSLFYASIGKRKTHIFNIISYLIYLYICIDLFYMGEIMSALLGISQSIIFIFSWKKQEHKNEFGEKVVKPNKIKAKELVIANIACVVIFAVSFLVFNLIESSEVLLNSVIMAFAIITYYFTFRVSKLSFFYSLVCVVMYMILWIKSLTNGINYAGIYVIGSVFSIVWRIISIYNWTKMEKQNANAIEKIA